MSDWSERLNKDLEEEEYQRELDRIRWDRYTRDLGFYGWNEFERWYHVTHGDYAGSTNHSSSGWSKNDPATDALVVGLTVVVFGGLMLFFTGSLTWSAFLAGRIAEACAGIIATILILCALVFLWLEAFGCVVPNY